MVVQHRLFNTADYPLFQVIHDIARKRHDVPEKISDYLKQFYY
jgi:hypothetical protein